MNLSWITLSNPVAIWWLFLVGVSALNCSAWTKARLSLPKDPTTKKLLLLSGAYVFGCAFRSLLPRADVQRICLFDTWLSSVFVGRSVATIAELCFVAEWAELLSFLAQESKANFTSKIARMIVPLICVAEICSWYAVVTTNYIGNCVEESLWGVSYFLIVLALLDLRSHFQGWFRRAIILGAIGCAMYVMYMATVDVPMYMSRHQADIASGKQFLGFMDGIKDLNTRWMVTHDVKDWGYEFLWMSLYFSVAVWMSILLCPVPALLKRKLAPVKSIHKIL